MMRIVLALLYVAAVLQCIGVNAERSLNKESSLEQSDFAVEELRSVENGPVRLPRKFRENSRTRRLHIENQHGFDGKVEKIHITSEEDLPGIMAFGMQKKNLANNGYIEKATQEKTIEEMEEDASRVARSIEAYGKSKEQLEMNGHIERKCDLKSVCNQHPTTNIRNRATRSIEAGVKQDDLTHDLEAQDAKVFRPLFVYRQQVAKREHRAKNHIYGLPTGYKSWHNPRWIF